VVCSALLVASAPSAPLRRPLWAGFATVVAAWIAMIGGAIVVLTEIELQRSRDAAGAGNYPQAVDRAKAARTIQPWAGEPYLQLAQLYGQSGDVAAALRYLGQAEDRDSNDWRLSVVEGTLDQQLDRQEAATRAFQRAERLSPFSLVSLLEAPPREDRTGR
jgi:tetratricopeptide (TPR) repeat protein